MKRRSLLLVMILASAAAGFLIVSAWSDRQPTAAFPIKPGFIAGLTEADLELAETDPLSTLVPVTDGVANGPFEGQFRLALSEWGPQIEFARARRETVDFLQMPDGRSYGGDVLRGAPNGWGVFSQSNGTRLEGEWRYGIPYRISGHVVLPDGTVEDGSWDFVRGTGNGTITWRDGHTYNGSWKIAPGYSPELPEGTGTIAWPDGHRYVGHFLDGQMHGWGTMTQSDGKAVDGLWRHGEFVLSRIDR